MTYLHAACSVGSHMKYFSPGEGDGPGSFLTLLISFDRQAEVSYPLLTSFAAFFISLMSNTHYKQGNIVHKDF